MRHFVNEFVELSPSSRKQQRHKNKGHKQTEEDLKFAHLSAPQQESASLTERVCPCLTPTLVILGLKSPAAFEKTASTTSAADMDAYFFLRSRRVVEKKDPAPWAGSNTLFFTLLSCSRVSSSSSLWMTSLAASRMVCSMRLTLFRVWQGVLNKLRITHKLKSSFLFNYNNILYTLSTRLLQRI